MHCDLLIRKLLLWRIGPGLSGSMYCRTNPLVPCDKAEKPEVGGGGSLILHQVGCQGFTETFPKGLLHRKRVGTYTIEPRGTYQRFYYRSMETLYEYDRGHRWPLQVKLFTALLHRPIG